jgi:hypothetical protein
MESDILIAALIKGEERYIVMYAERYTGEALRTIGRWASDPDLSFNWDDAAATAQRMRQNAEVA